MRLHAKAMSILMVLVLSLMGSAAVMAQETGETGDGQSGEVPIQVQVGASPDAGLNWSVTVNSDFPPVASSFETQTTSGALTLTVEDTRGTEAGWSIDVSATDFVGQESGRTFAIDNFSVTPGTINVVAGQRTPLPAVNTVILSSSPQTLMSAAPGSGAGRYSVAMTGTITIPSGTLVDAYRTTITVDLAAAP